MSEGDDDTTNVDDEDDDDDSSSPEESSSSSSSTSSPVLPDPRPAAFLRPQQMPRGASRLSGADAGALSSRRANEPDGSYSDLQREHQSMVERLAALEERIGSGQRLALGSSAAGAGGGLEGGGETLVSELSLGLREVQGLVLDLKRRLDILEERHGEATRMSFAIQEKFREDHSIMMDMKERLATTQNAVSKLEGVESGMLKFLWVGLGWFNIGISIIAQFFINIIFPTWADSLESSAGSVQEDNEASRLAVASIHTAMGARSKQRRGVAASAARAPGASDLSKVANLRFKGDVK